MRQHWLLVSLLCAGSVVAASSDGVARTTLFVHDCAARADIQPTPSHVHVVELHGIHFDAPFQSWPPSSVSLASIGDFLHSLARTLAFMWSDVIISPSSAPIPDLRTTVLTGADASALAAAAASARGGSTSTADELLLRMLDPLGVTYGVWNHTLHAAKRSLEEVAGAVGVDVHRTAASLAHALELTRTGAHASPYAISHKDEVTYVVLVSASTPFAITCHVNYVALKYPARAAAGLFLYSNAGVISEALPLYYGTGFLTGGIVALVVLALFLFRNRTNRVAWSIGIVTAVATLFDSYTHTVTQWVTGASGAAPSSVSGGILAYVSANTWMLIAIYFVVSGCIFMGVMYMWRAAENERIHAVIHIALRVIGGALLLSAIQPFQLQMLVVSVGIAVVLVYYVGMLVMAATLQTARVVCCVLETLTYPIPCCWPVFAACRRTCPGCFCKRKGDVDDEEEEGDFEPDSTPQAATRPQAVASEHARRGRRLSRDPAAIRGMFSAPQPQRARSHTNQPDVPVPVPVPVHHMDLDAVDDAAGTYMHPPPAQYGHASAPYAYPPPAQYSQYAPPPPAQQHFTPPFQHSQVHPQQQLHAQYALQQQQQPPYAAVLARAHSVPIARFAPPLAATQSPAPRSAAPIPLARPTAPPASPQHDDDDDEEEEDEPQEVQYTSAAADDDDQEEEEEQHADDDDEVMDEHVEEEEEYYDPRMDDDAPDAHLPRTHAGGKRSREEQSRVSAAPPRPHAQHAVHEPRKRARE